MNTDIKVLSAGVTSISLSFLLAACGGGDLGGDEGFAVPAADSVLAEIIQDYCQLDALDTASFNGEVGYSYSPASLWRYSTNAGATHDELSAVQAHGLNNLPVMDKLVLNTSVRDHRGFTEGSNIGSAVADGRFGQGAVIPDLFADKSVACVKSVSQMHLLTNSSYGSLDSLPSARLVWQSFAAPIVPVEQLPGHAIDGFEMVANFQAAAGLVYFSLPTGTIADANAASICHMPQSGTYAGAWNCQAPTIVPFDGGVQFELPAARPGVYMLVSSHPEFGR